MASLKSALNWVALSACSMRQPTTRRLKMSSDVEVEVGPFHRPHQFGDVPRPHLVGSLGQQFGLLIDRVTPLSAAFDDLAMGGKDAIHRSDRAQIDAFIEQGGIDFGRGLIREAGCAQMSKHLIPFTFRQGACDR